MRIIDEDEIRVVLRLLGAKGIGSRTLGRILDDCLGRGVSLAEFGKPSGNELATRFRLPADSAHSFDSGADAASRLWEELAEHAVHVLVRGCPGYPEHLRAARDQSAPPVLFAIGNLDLFQQPAVGFCGSRKASERGRGIASECARFFAAKGVNVVSGYANGVDLAAHRAALDAGGTTTLVLAEGILHFRVKADIKSFVSDANMLAVSEFPPRLPWTGRSAMARNHTICGLSNAMILVESGAEGGTFECGKVALEQRCPLFVVEYAQPPASAEGNAFFLQRGAHALRRSSSGSANLEALMAVASSRAAEDNGNQQNKLLVEDQ